MCGLQHPRGGSAAQQGWKAAGTGDLEQGVELETGFLPLLAGDFCPGVGTVVPNYVCPVVVNFEELLVTDSEGTPLERWPVDARGPLS
jgi:hypothetical protein